MLWKALRKHQSMQRAKSMRRPVLAIVVGLVLVLGVGYLKQRGIAIGFGSQPVAAQTMRPESVAATVYQRLPNLPKENQYLRRDTGKVDEQNTLVARLVRYHQDLKKRQTNFRLDWKLTLADYLGVNEPIKPDRYPGQSSLKTNPMENDVKAIRHLNRRQRDELVDALVSAYKANEPNPPTPNANQNSNSLPKPAPQSPSVPSSSSPSMSKPGDSQLLQP